MSDLTAWVPLWERCPELVPGGWHCDRGQWVSSIKGYGFDSFLTPKNPDPIDIDAQIGRAVVWLAKHPCVVLHVFKDGLPIITAGKYPIRGQQGAELIDNLRALCEVVLNMTDEQLSSGDAP